MPSLANIAAQIRYERKQAQKYALKNAKLEDLDAAVLGIPHRDIVELCDRKIEALRQIQAILYACRPVRKRPAER